MIEALCHGKLPRELEGMEDLLTSAVFGRLKYMPLSEGLIRFFSAAEYRGGQKLPLGVRMTERAEYHFWPWMQLDDCCGAEPDVVIDLWETGGAHYKVLIEAKFRSAKSSRPDPNSTRPTDQLSREWDNLVRACERDNAQPIMLYLTADFAFPREEIEESALEFHAKRTDLAKRYPFSCAWLSWRHLPVAFNGADHSVARDLLSLITRLDLKFFEGITNISPVMSGWVFERPEGVFDFHSSPLSPWEWRFKR